MLTLFKQIQSILSTYHKWDVNSSEFVNFIIAVVTRSLRIEDVTSVGHKRNFAAVIIPRYDIVCPNFPAERVAAYK